MDYVICASLKVNALWLDCMKDWSSLHRKHFTVFWSISLVLHYQQLSADVFPFWQILRCKKWMKKLNKEFPLSFVAKRKIGCGNTWTIKRLSGTMLLKNVPFISGMQNLKVARNLFKMILVLDVHSLEKLESVCWGPRTVFWRRKTAINNH
jgi:hypothetical protein